MIRFGLAAFAALLAGCADDNAPSAPAPESAPAEEAAPAPVSAPADQDPLADPAAQPLEGEPDSAWIELMGVWAETGRCGDDTGRWIIEGDAFHLFETHCAVDRLELLQNGVKATAQCSVEGDDDGVADVYWFLRQGDGSLTVVQDFNKAMTTGLFPCEESVEL